MCIASTTEFETSVLPTQGDRRGGGGGKEDTAVPENSEVRYSAIYKKAIAFVHISTFFFAVGGFHPFLSARRGTAEKIFKNTYFGLDVLIKP